MDKILSKSSYLKGLESHAYLWRSINAKETIPLPTPEEIAKMETGNQIGKLAYKLYPDGVCLADMDFNENLIQTEELVRQRKIIFEAGFNKDRLYSRIDILVPVEDDQWDIIEVKSSTECKKAHISDVAFQLHICGISDINIRHTHIVYINKHYAKNGEVVVNEFFKKEDITEKVETEVKVVPEQAQKLIQVIDLEECPDFDFNDISKSEYGNIYINEFNANLPDGSVWELYNDKSKKKYLLWNAGIKLLKDIPEDYKISSQNKIQIETSRHGNAYIDQEAIKTFVSTIHYPIYYLDFESFSLAIPTYEDTKPYMQIPFQYSLHIEYENGTIEHKEFLHTDTSDPRPYLLNSLINDLGKEGTILTYNQSFEKAIIKSIAAENEGWREPILERMNDLLIPFRNFHYYHPNQKGSCSIKAVLPVFSDLSYKGLAISNGGQAMTTYAKYFVNQEQHPNKSQLIQDMLVYCKQDTWAMVVILRELRSIIKWIKK